jgi:hypothetical protein
MGEMTDHEFKTKSPEQLEDAPAAETAIETRCFECGQRCIADVRDAKPRCDSCTRRHDSPPASDDRAGLRMTRGRLAAALHKLGEDVARLQLRLRGLAPFLGGRDPGADGRLEIIHDSLREQACRLVDLATAVRLGEAPIVAFEDEAEQLPLFPGGPDPAARPKRRRKAKAGPEPTTEAVS